MERRKEREKKIYYMFAFKHSNIEVVNIWNVCVAENVARNWWVNGKKRVQRTKQLE